MSPIRKPIVLVIFTCLAFLLLNAGITTTAQAQQIQVTAADPPSAEQGAVNLNVRIIGKGFKSGAQAKFLVTKTEDAGGITVNSTTYVSSTELTANITVSDTAAVANFDIQVLNKDGRAGKGTELFRVTVKGSVKLGCTATLGTPAGYTLVTTLNDGMSPKYLGTAVAAAPSGLERVVVAAGTGSSGYAEIFNLDAAGGAVLGRESILVSKPIRWLVAGDVDADGVPDFVGSSGDGPGAVLLRGSLQAADGSVSYKAISFPNPPNFNGRKFRKTVALGELDGLAGDEIALASVTSSGRTVPGQIHIYRFNGAGLEWLRTIEDPARSGDFGYSVGIGDVREGVGNELLVGALGRVLIIGAPLGTSSTTITLTASGSSNLGVQVAGADVDADGYQDVIAAASNSALAFPGLVNASSTPLYQLNPDPGDLGGVWAVWGFHALSDVSGDGRADILVGAPAPQGSPCQIGTVHLFSSETLTLLPSVTPTTAVFQPPVVNGDGAGYGGAVGAVPADPALLRPALVLVGDASRNASAGEVYVYRRN